MRTGCDGGREQATAINAVHAAIVEKPRVLVPLVDIVAASLCEKFS